jgi:hypothetical protein
MFRQLRKALVGLVGSDDPAELHNMAKVTSAYAASALERMAALVAIDALIKTQVAMPTVVCLCGSGRFLDAFNAVEFTETLAGKIVLTIGCNTHDVARCASLAPAKPMLDELHLRKIDLADEVLILNVGGYIGESTSRELAYARQAGKTIRFLESATPEGSLPERTTS